MLYLKTYRKKNFHCVLSVHIQFLGESTCYNARKEPRFSWPGQDLPAALASNSFVIPFRLGLIHPTQSVEVTPQNMCEVGLESVESN